MSLFKATLILDILLLIAPNNSKKQSNQNVIIRFYKTCNFNFFFLVRKESIHSLLQILFYHQFRLYGFQQREDLRFSSKKRCVF